jgi:predicted HAD superfamily phosphohydrolase
MSSTLIPKDHPPTEEVREALVGILKFIEKQPEAKHTAEGIAKTWIFQQRLEEKIEVILVVIQYLVQKGFLEEIYKEDDECYYRVNKVKLREIPDEIKMIGGGDE